MNADVIIVGAGIAGLSCARTLREAGRRTIILEKSRGVGGRCATRRVHGQAVDHGVAFLHGSDPEFLSTVRSLKGATLLDPWPRRVTGNGPPCQPDAFSEGEARLAYAEGITAFPKSLAGGLNVRLETRVTGVNATGSGIEVSIEGGPPLRARDAVLALPAEQTADLLGPLAAFSREAAAARSLLGMVGSLPTLAVLAGYGLEIPVPDWDVWYPKASEVLQILVYDSGKRPESVSRAFVYQARPSWSRLNIEGPVERWSGAVLEEAARLLGPWAGRPRWSSTHIWRYARADRGNEFNSPILIRCSPGVRLGLAGEVFAPGGGIEAAWLSGRRLARRLLDEE
jgi:predicted NAD/FAD-dependent oxidoreductase